MSDDRHPPRSMLEQWEAFADACRQLGHVTVGEARANWQPWAIAAGLAWLVVVAVTVLP